MCSSDLEKLNQRWVDIQLKKLNAKWIMVVDGQIALHGATLQDYPEDEDFLELCEKTGKYPFVFFSPRVFAIEELSTAWHKTNEQGDLYPVLPIVLSDKNKQFEAEADLDTGAVDCYCPLELLVRMGIIKMLPRDNERTSQHLSQPFIYFAKRVWLELVDASGIHRRVRTAVICVEDWQNSPFVSINPSRTFLAGREVLLALQPRLILDFAAKRTEVQFPETTS